MSDNYYGPYIHRQQGGNVLVVRAFDGGQVFGQTSAAATPAQASAVASITTTDTFSTGICAKIEAIRDALTNVGILATG